MRRKRFQFLSTLAVVAVFGSALPTLGGPKEELDLRFRCYFFQSASKYLAIDILVDLDDRPVLASSTYVDGNDTSLPLLIDLTEVDESRKDVKHYRGRGFSLRVESRRTPVSNIPYFYGQLKWRQLDPKLAYSMTCTT